MMIARNIFPTKYRHRIDTRTNGQTNGHIWEWYMHVGARCNEELCEAMVNDDAVIKNSPNVNLGRLSPVNDFSGQI